MAVVTRFEGIRIYEIYGLTGGAAFSLPGFGIFTGQGHSADTDLLRHEFGHILQARSYGYLRFYLLTAPASLFSAFCERLIPNYFHRYAAVELSANALSYAYFGGPADWDLKNFPLVK